MSWDKVTVVQEGGRRAGGNLEAGCCMYEGWVMMTAAHVSGKG